MDFDKRCGRFGLSVGPPHPRWATITLDGVKLDKEKAGHAHFELDDLRDLQYLIGRALEGR